MIPGTDGMWKQVQAPKVLTENPWIFPKSIFINYFLLLKRKLSLCCYANFFPVTLHLFHEFKTNDDDNMEKIQKLKM